MLSGYFLRRSNRFSVDLVLRPMRRLIPVYVFWVLTYFVLLHLIPLRPWSFPPHEWLWGGTAYHLWFLPALAFALVFVGVGFSTVGPRYTGLACATLGLFALLRGSYHDVLHLSGAAAGRNEQYAGPLYVYIGAMLPQWSSYIAKRWLPVLVIFGFCMAFAEQKLIAWLANDPLIAGHDVIISVFGLSAAIVLLARALPDAAPVRWVASLGRISLGIYAVHLFFIWLLLPYIGNSTLPEVLVLSVAVLAISTVVSLLLQRVPGLRSVVR